MVIGIVLITLSVSEFLLGLFFILGYQRKQATIWYGLFLFGVSVYVGANGLGYLEALVRPQVAEQFAWMGGVLTAVFILPFSFTFPVARKKVVDLVPIVVWPALLFPLGLLLTDLIIIREGVVRFVEGYQTNQGPYFYVMIAFFAVYWLWALLNFVRNIMGSDGMHRWQLKMILIGLTASLLSSSYFDILLPASSGSASSFIGALMTSVCLFFTSLIIIKR